MGFVLLLDCCCLVKLVLGEEILLNFRGSVVGRALALRHGPLHLSSLVPVRCKFNNYRLNQEKNLSMVLSTILSLSTCLYVHLKTNYEFWLLSLENICQNLDPAL